MLSNVWGFLVCSTCFRSCHNISWALDLNVDLTIPKTCICPYSLIDVFVWVEIFFLLYDPFLFRLQVKWYFPVQFSGTKQNSCCFQWFQVIQVLRQQSNLKACHATSMFDSWYENLTIQCLFFIKHYDSHVAGKKSLVCPRMLLQKSGVSSWCFSDKL